MVEHGDHMVTWPPTILANNRLCRASLRVRTGMVWEVQWLLWCTAGAVVHCWYTPN